MMRKRITAIVLSALLLLSCPLTALAAANVRVPAFGDVVTAVQADLNDRAAGTSALARLSISLLRTLTEKAKNTEITVEDIKASVDEASALIAKVYEKMGSYAAKMLDKARDKIGDLVSTEETTTAPSDDNGGGNGNGSGNNDSEPTTQPPADETEKITFAALSDLMKKYVFIKVDNADEVAELIAESCDFTYTTINGEDGTVYIRVDIEENPEIFNYAVFRNLVEDLYKQQGEKLLKDGDGNVDYLMSYEHIAGELALHALLYAASSELLHVGVDSGRLLNLYKSAAKADLNVDEARIPAELISIVGTLLMNFMSYHLLNAFGLI